MSHASSNSAGVTRRVAHDTHSPLMNAARPSIRDDEHGMCLGVCCRSANGAVKRKPPEITTWTERSRRQPRSSRRRIRSSAIWRARRRSSTSRTRSTTGSTRLAPASGPSFRNRSPSPRSGTSSFAEYDVEREQCERDLLDLLQKLAAEGPHRRRVGPPSSRHAGPARTSRPRPGRAGLPHGESRRGVSRIWRDAGSTNRVLVHIDAHHDMWWIDDDESLTIANFITPALKNGLIRQLFWVVPDATWQTTEGREAVSRHVGKSPDVSWRCQPRSRGVESVRTQVLGKPLTVCSLDALPTWTMDEGVLPRYRRGLLRHPERLVRRSGRSRRASMVLARRVDLALCARQLCTDLATIAYSVEGGLHAAQMEISRGRTGRASHASPGR